MRKLAMWIIDNMPCGPLAPHIFGFAIGARKKKYNKSLNCRPPEAAG